MGGKQDTIVVVGDSKQEYQTNLVQALGTIQNVTNGLGLGFEVNESFNDGFDFSKTWNKYATVYRRKQVYSLGFKDTDPARIQSYLTGSAKELLKSGSPNEIISKLGTHYMTRAAFGSLTRWSSVLDVRDDKIAKSF